MKLEISEYRQFIKDIKYMRNWYLFWSDANRPQVVGEIFKIPWGYNSEIITKAKSRLDNPIIGVSEYQLVSQLPEEFKSSLPSIEEIEAEIGGGDYD